MKKKILIWTLGLAMILPLLTRCGGKDEPEPEQEKEKTAVLKADRDTYMQLDVLTLAVPAEMRLVADSYDGTVGTASVKAVRKDTVLLIMIPEIPAGRYPVTVQIGDTKATANIQVTALPEVANPAEVVASISESFAAVFDGVEKADAASGKWNSEEKAFLKKSIADFNTALSKATDAEKATVARWWNAHPEFGDFFSAGNGLKRSKWIDDEMNADLIEYSVTVMIVATTGVILFVAAATGDAPLLIADGILVLIAYKRANMLCDRIIRRAFRVKELMIQRAHAQYPRSLSLSTRSEAVFEFTNDLKADVNVEGLYRSLTDGDSTDPATSGELGSFFEATGRMFGFWDDIRDYAGLFSLETPAAPSAEPLNTESRTVDATDWTLSIVSGDVSFDKAAMTFSTQSKEDVNFQFKVKDSNWGIESETCDAVLKVEKEVELTGGIWKLIKYSQTLTFAYSQESVLYVHDCEAEKSHPVFYLVFSEDGRSVCSGTLPVNYTDEDLRRRSECTKGKPFSSESWNTETLGFPHLKRGVPMKGTMPVLSSFEVIGTSIKDETLEFVFAKIPFVSGGNYPVTGVTLNETSRTLTVGGSFQLTATVSPSNASVKTVTWESSNNAVATVSSSGYVTAKAAGTAVITATTDDGGFTATCTVIVETVNDGTVWIYTGEIRQLQYYQNGVASNYNYDNYNRDPVRIRIDREKKSISFINLEAYRKDNPEFVTGTINGNTFSVSGRAYWDQGYWDTDYTGTFSEESVQGNWKTRSYPGMSWYITGSFSATRDK